ncbi:MAG: DUF6261 family protein, partial [Tannerellaceae bacterium]|nr:DUF6261 family protein [Tannerellaceae bacterium]
VEAGQKRYDIFMMFHRTIDAASYSYTAADKEAATILQEILKNYKAIGSATMTETSALIVNMVEDMGKSRYADAAKTLSLTGTVAKLAEANDEFRELYIERANSLEDSEEMGTMREIRAQVDKAFKLFTQALDVAYASGKLSGDKDVTEAGKLIDRINAIIDQFRRVLSHRGHVTGKKEDNGDDFEPEPPAPLYPIVAIAQQSVESSIRMLLQPANVEAFNQALYPMASSSTLRLWRKGAPEDEFVDFRFSEFQWEGGVAQSMSYTTPDRVNMSNPMESEGPARAEVIKEGETLATLTGLVYPKMRYTPPTD